MPQRRFVVWLSGAIRVLGPLKLLVGGHLADVTTAQGSFWRRGSLSLFLSCAGKVRAVPATLQQAWPLCCVRSPCWALTCSWGSLGLSQTAGFLLMLCIESRIYELWEKVSPWCQDLQSVIADESCVGLGVGLSSAWVCFIWKLEVV